MLNQKILFTKEECNWIIQLSNKYPLLGSNGRWDKFDNFKYKFYTLDSREDVTWIIERLCNYFEKEMNLQMFSKPSVLNLHYFTIGDEFGKHIDKGNPIKEWNIGIVLNEDYVGGDYIIYDKNDNPIVIDKKIGNVCIYQSQTPHEVTPVISGERWTIAMFIAKFRMYPPNKII
jgi:hypothetical protein